MVGCSRCENLPDSTILFLENHYTDYFSALGISATLNGMVMPEELHAGLSKNQRFIVTQLVMGYPDFVEYRILNYYGGEVNREIAHVIQITVSRLNKKLARFGVKAANLEGFGYALRQLEEAHAR